MKQAKVLEILGCREWTWDHWTVFYIQMKLDNWETITLGKKKSDAFKVGDQVSYEVVEEGKKWKEVKENPFQRKPFNQEANNRWAMIGMAIKTAFEVFYDPKKENFKETMALAQRIFEEAMSMFNEWGEEKESAKDDKLPF